MGQVWFEIGKSRGVLPEKDMPDIVTGLVQTLVMVTVRAGEVCPRE